MTQNTAKGCSYAVTPKSACIVTAPDGTVIAECPVGTTTTFISTVEQVTISDDEAYFVKVFKGASSAASGGGASASKIIEIVKSVTQNTFDPSSTSPISGKGVAEALTIAGWSLEIVDTLPASGEEKVIYLVPSNNPASQNAKDEFIWTNGTWELVGSTAIDLSNYATKTDVNTAIASNIDQTFNATSTKAQSGTAVQGGINVHANNTTIHVTATEKANWNAKPTTAEMDAAIASAVVGGGVDQVFDSTSTAAQSGVAIEGKLNDRFGTLNVNSDGVLEIAKSVEIAESDPQSDIIYELKGPDGTVYIQVKNVPDPI